ncbi:hypothetical protein M514_20027 [Trichuris suis]|uniref:Uncharacterized protein n=1 Tax=Trichuris suis TaxID=68888 RepID=A0A085NE36_9BILA|nr:hypothetical protein M514_20027 [Trichuris suis]
MTLLIDNSQLLERESHDFCWSKTKRALQWPLRHARARYDPLVELGRAGSTSLRIDHSSMNNHPVRSALFGRRHFARSQRVLARLLQRKGGVNRRQNWQLV